MEVESVRPLGTNHTPGRYYDRGQPRPPFHLSDTYIAHEQGLCRYADGQCDADGLHAKIAQRARAAAAHINL